MTPRERSVRRLRATETSWRHAGVTVERMEEGDSGPTVLSRSLLAMPGLNFREAQKTTPRGGGSPEKVTTTFGLHYMHTGVLRMMIGSRTHLLDPATVMMTAPGLAYRFASEGEGVAECTHFTMTESALDRFGLHPPPVEAIAFVADGASRLHLRQRLLAGRLLAGTRLDPVESEAECLGILAESLSRLRAGAGRGRPGDTAGAANRRRVAFRVRELLAARYRDPLTLEHIAREVGGSPFHLTRIFKSVVGVTIHQYLRCSRCRGCSGCRPTPCSCPPCILCTSCTLPPPLHPFYRTQQSYRGGFACSGRHGPVWSRCADAPGLCARRRIHRTLRAECILRARRAHGVLHAN